MLRWDSTCSDLYDALDSCGVHGNLALFAELLCQLRCQSGLNPQHLGVRFPPEPDEDVRPQLCLDRRVLFRGS